MLDVDGRIIGFVVDDEHGSRDCLGATLAIVVSQPFEKNTKRTAVLLDDEHGRY